MYYTVKVPAYRSSEYTYESHDVLEPGTVVRVPRRQFGSCQINTLYTHGVVVAELDDCDSSFPVETCVRMAVLEDFTSEQLEHELQDRDDKQQADRFGVSLSMYRELRAHFADGA